MSKKRFNPLRRGNFVKKRFFPLPELSGFSDDSDKEEVCSKLASPPQTYSPPSPIPNYVFETIKRIAENPNVTQFPTSTPVQNYRRRTRLDFTPINKKYNTTEESVQDTSEIKEVNNKSNNNDVSPNTSGTSKKSSDQIQSYDSHVTTRKSIFPNRKTKDPQHNLQIQNEGSPESHTVSSVSAEVSQHLLHCLSFYKKNEKVEKLIKVLSSQNSIDLDKDEEIEHSIGSTTEIQIDNIDNKNIISFQKEKIEELDKHITQTINYEGNSINKKKKNSQNLQDSNLLDNADEILITSSNKENTSKLSNVSNKKSLSQNLQREDANETLITSSNKINSSKLSNVSNKKKLSQNLQKEVSNETLITSNNKVNDSQLSNTSNKESLSRNLQREDANENLITSSNQINSSKLSNVSNKKKLSQNLQKEVANENLVTSNNKVNDSQLCNTSNKESFSRNLQREEDVNENLITSTNKINDSKLLNLENERNSSKSQMNISGSIKEKSKKSAIKQNSISENKINITQKSSSNSSSRIHTQEYSRAETVKRRPGRPKKLKTETFFKRPRGRPRKLTETASSKTLKESTDKVDEKLNEILYEENEASNNHLLPQLEPVPSTTTGIITKFNKNVKDKHSGTSEKRVYKKTLKRVSKGKSEIKEVTNLNFVDLRLEFCGELYDRSTRTRKPRNRDFTGFASYISKCPHKEQYDSNTEDQFNKLKYEPKTKNKKDSGKTRKTSPKQQQKTRSNSKQQKNERNKTKAKNIKSQSEESAASKIESSSASNLKLSKSKNNPNANDSIEEENQMNDNNLIINENENDNLDVLESGQQTTPKLVQNNKVDNKKSAKEKKNKRNQNPDLEVVNKKKSEDTEANKECVTDNAEIVLFARYTDYRLKNVEPKSQHNLRMTKRLFSQIKSIEWDAEPSNAKLCKYNRKPELIFEYYSPGVEICNFTDVNGMLKLKASSKYEGPTVRYNMFYVLRSGQGTLEIDNSETIQMSIDNSYMVPKGAEHSIQNFTTEVTTIHFFISL